MGIFQVLSSILRWQTYSNRESKPAALRILHNSQVTDMSYSVLVTQIVGTVKGRYQNHLSPQMSPNEEDMAQSLSRIQE